MKSKDNPVLSGREFKSPFFFNEASLQWPSVPTPCSKVTVPEGHSVVVEETSHLWGETEKTM